MEKIITNSIAKVQVEISDRHEGRGLSAIGLDTVRGGRRARS